MASTIKFTLSLLDGSDVVEREFEGAVATWMCLADRVRFEKRFGQHASAMRMWESDDEEGARPDPTQLREEYVAFFVWCEARRRLDDFPDYDKFVEQVVGVDMEVVGKPHPTKGKRSGA